MGSGYLIDSNAVIDFLMFQMPSSGVTFLYEIDPAISIITRIELFCKTGIDANDLFKLQQFISGSLIYQIEEEIALKTIDIRLKYKLKLPDAVIAATALHHHLTLITRNTSDFKNIKGLKLIDPYNL